MKMVRVVLGAALCAALAVPAMAQMPPGPDVTCLCLQQALAAAQGDMQAKQSELNNAQAQLAELDRQLNEARAHADVNNPQAVAQFRQSLEQRDAAFKQTNGPLLAAAQAATANYNQVVASYNNQCAGRPLPPPPPGPLMCR
jgi:TolA-binding protein